MLASQVSIARPASTFRPASFVFDQFMQKIGPQPSKPAPAIMDKTLKDLFLNSDYSDMKIICDKQEFPAHKAVVCRGSVWFKRACSSGFKMNPCESSGEIRLTDKDPILIRRVLEYLYSSEYNTNSVALDICTPVGETSPSVNQFGVRKRKSSLSTKAPSSPKESPRKRTRSAVDLPDADKTVDLIRERKSSDPESPQSSRTQLIETNFEDWPPLTTCPPSYFHARMFAEADYFMLDDLKEQAKGLFDTSLKLCDTDWKLELIITELWSPRADYKPLQSILLQRVMDESCKVGHSFITMDRAFFDSVPIFTADFCWQVVKKRRDNWRYCPNEMVSDKC